MAADAPRAADTRGWLRRAAADLRGADVDLAADPPLIGDAVYRATRSSPRRSYAIRLTADPRIDALEESSHALRRLQRDELNAVPVQDGLHLLPRG
jgi:hypothetical protein